MTTRTFASSPVVATGRGRRPLSAPWADRLVETHVDARAGRPALTDLRFRDPQHRLLAEAELGIGAAVRVSAVTTAGGGRIQIFAGEVTRVACEVDDDGTFTTIRAQDLGHRLTRGRRVAVWKRTTLRQVVEDVAKHAKLKVGQVADANAAYRHLVQPNITDWEFLHMLAGIHGSTPAVRGDSLSLRPSQPARRAPDPRQDSDRDPYVLRYGDNLLSLDTSLEDLGPVRTVQVRGWNADKKEPLTARTDLTDSDQVAAGIGLAQLRSAWSGDTVTEVAGTGFAFQEHLAAAAESFAGEAAADFARLEATASGSPYLAAGAAVTLAGVGAPFTGRYTVTGSHHHFGDAGYQTTVWVSAGQREAGPAAAGPGAYAVPGLAVGIVVDVKEPDGRQNGAVKVTFPWLHDTYTTDWARTLQWGGSGGGVISPSAGDEVLVGFEQGRLDRPFVLGGLYNGRDKPAKHSVDLVSEDGTVNRRSLASRGGDRVELLDAKGSAGLLLATGDGGVEVQFDRANKTLKLTADTIELNGKTVTVNGTNVAINGSTVAVSAGTVNVKRGTPPPPPPPAPGGAA